jgi:UDPglucose--hexose-1-phosphate uridylyltransferase
MTARPQSALIQDQPHRRHNPLTGEWVLVSPHRTERPWQGKIESAPVAQRPAYDPSCYLCPGNGRANGATNPPYDGVYVFDNDFSALLPDTATGPDIGRTFGRQHPVRGVCRVLCFSPRHDLTLALMGVHEICRVVDLWAAQAEELGCRYRWVQIFENRGEIMGCSNSHPHGQLWAGSSLPNEPAKEDTRQRGYLEEHRSVLLLDYLDWESAERTRIVVENTHWVALVPFWALWPFEILLMPRRHVRQLMELDSGERRALAEMLKQLLTRYDNLFETSFPYTMGWHAAPHGSGGDAHWQLHAHFYPPLLRSATVKKFMVGYEMLAEPQRDITPEAAALRLQSLRDTHYSLGPEGSKP